MMRTGISTACLYPLELERSFQTLLSLDFRLFEVFLNTFSEFTLDYLRQLRNVADAYGAEIKSVHPFTSGYEGSYCFLNTNAGLRIVWSFINSILMRQTVWVLPLWCCTGKGTMPMLAFPKRPILNGMRRSMRWGSATA